MEQMVVVLGSPSHPSAPWSPCGVADEHPAALQHCGVSKQLPWPG